MSFQSILSYWPPRALYIDLRIHHTHLLTMTETLSANSTYTDIISTSNAQNDQCLPTYSTHTQYPPSISTKSCVLGATPLSSVYRYMNDELVMWLTTATWRCLHLRVNRTTSWAVRQKPACRLPRHTIWSRWIRLTHRLGTHVSYRLSKLRLGHRGVSAHLSLSHCFAACRFIFYMTTYEVGENAL